MKQKQAVELVTIKIEERTREEELKALYEWLAEKLKVDDHFNQQGRYSLARMHGLAEGGPTIFKFEVEADGDEELIKQERTVQYKKKELPRVVAVAIGPYHHHDKSLRFNDDYKWKITRFMVNYYRLDPKKYFTEIEKKERSARSCYDRDLSEWNSQVFLTMLLLDSCFVLFAMDAFCQRLLWPQNFYMDYVALYPDIRKHSKQIKLDLLMVDNQIPFFTIKQLLHCFPEGGDIFKGKSIQELALLSFDDLWPTRNNEQKMDLRPTRSYKLKIDLWPTRNNKQKMDLWPLRNNKQKMDDEAEFDHLLQLFHWSRIPVEGYEMNSGLRKKMKMKIASEQRIPSATELQKFAIKFKKKTSGSNLDITFTRTWLKTCAVFNIPTLHLYDYSEQIFRNLIAFEMNPTNDVRCFTAYLACMSCLLQREEDVQLLRESGTIASTSYNNANVDQFFKDLNQEVQDHTKPDTLLHLYDHVMEHHKSCVSKFYGGFKMQYCPNMWVGLSLVAASVLFILALLQTIYTMK